MRQLWKQVSFLAACVCVFVYVRLLITNWCNLVGIWAMVNAKRWRNLATFDLNLWSWELFSYFFSTQALPWLDLATSLSVWRYIFRILFSIKVMDPRSRSRQRKACNSKTTAWKLLGLDRNMCYDNARSHLEVFDIWTWPVTLRDSYFFNSNSEF